MWFFFTLTWREFPQFDEHILGMGWFNHQLYSIYCGFPISLYDFRTFFGTGISWGSPKRWSNPFSSDKNSTWNFRGWMDGWFGWMIQFPKNLGVWSFHLNQPSIHPWISNHQTSLLSGANFVSFRWLSRWSTFLDLRSWDEKTWPRWCRFSFFFGRKKAACWWVSSFLVIRVYIYIFILYNLYIYIFWDSHIIHILRCRSQFDWNIFLFCLSTSTWRGISRRQGRSTPAFYLWWSSFPIECQKNPALVKLEVKV